MAAKSSIIVQRQDGTTYDLDQEGIKVVSFDPPSPNFQNAYAQVSKYGSQLISTQIQQTSIPLVFDVTARDNYDYELQRLKVLRIFNSADPFYVINRRIPWLRWRVVADSFSYPRSGNYWKAKSVSINLVAIDGLAETVATTQDDFYFYVQKWGIGMGIDFNNVAYTFSDTEFNFFNPSSIPLLANERPVEITFNGNAPSGFTIINHTTNQSFTYFKALTTSDTLKLVGIVPTVNGIQRLGNQYTDRSFLDFAIGDNDIEIKGAKDFKISFNTRFYY